MSKRALLRLVFDLFFALVMWLVIYGVEALIARHSGGGTGPQGAASAHRGGCDDRQGGAGAHDAGASGSQPVR
jgi:hypothetical protein